MWQPIETAKTNGTPYLVTDGTHRWISSKKVSKVSKDGQPWDGHEWVLGGRLTHPIAWWDFGQYRNMPDLPEEVK